MATNPDSGLAKALGLLASFERIALAILMLAMVGLTVMGVAVREIVPAYARNVSWVDEGARYIMVWMVFLSLGLALAEGRQIAMTSFLEKMSPKVQLWVGRFIDLSGLALSLYIAWYGFEMAQNVARTGQFSPTLRIPAAIIYYALPAGFLLLALRYGLSLFGLIDRRANAGAAH
ncbi:TRAP-type C4-dicarboxylate transport system, small permease component [Devosia crocina]|uniref:TRAP transporter small permease protein n=1 Tax=Devosia crocina TaxID=429728 RepID=A0A1I7MYI8_9HYPH|nr:TRAP transporter small permease [Devosia crocina]SFV27477.1 TRAP-type C4-dicarboxylate transport system, small permease component [Devosia crocina]